MKKLDGDALRDGATADDPDKLLIELSRDELRMIIAALGEALEVRDTEFETRVGATRAEIEALIHASLAIHESGQ